MSSSFICQNPWLVAGNPIYILQTKTMSKSAVDGRLSVSQCTVVSGRRSAVLKYGNNTFY